MRSMPKPVPLNSSGIIIHILWDTDPIFSTNRFTIIYRYPQQQSAFSRLHPSIFWNSSGKLIKTIVGRFNERPIPLPLERSNIPDANSFVIRAGGDTIAVRREGKRLDRI